MSFSPDGQFLLFLKGDRQIDTNHLMTSTHNEHIMTSLSIQVHMIDTLMQSRPSENKTKTHQKWKECRNHLYTAFYVINNIRRAGIGSDDALYIIVIFSAFLRQC